MSLSVWVGFQMTFLGCMLSDEPSVVPIACCCWVDGAGFLSLAPLPVSDACTLGNPSPGTEFPDGFLCPPQQGGPVDEAMGCADRVCKRADCRGHHRRGGIIFQVPPSQCQLELPNSRALPELPQSHLERHSCFV